MVSRTAKCQCGDLRVRTVGEPTHVVMCHCEDCQRRTGSSYHLGAWYPEADVTVAGEFRRFVRRAESGSEVEFRFCPNCGTNICFAVPGLLPGMLGVAVGCFADPEFPAPEVSVYGKRRHRWLRVPAGVPAFREWTDGEPE